MTNSGNTQTKLLASGRIWLGLALLGFGLEQAVVRYALVDGLPPLPFWVPHVHVLAKFNALVLVVLGIAVIGRVRVAAASVLGALYFMGGALLHLHPWRPVLYHADARTGFLEPLAIGASLLVLACMSGTEIAPLLGVVGRVLFGLCMIVFGTQHFEDLRPIAALVPRWIPWHVFWVELTGAVFILAGAAIAVRAWQRVAALALAAMFFGWLVVLHLPLCASQPLSQALWASALVVVAMIGSSLVLAADGQDSRLNQS